TPDATGNPQHPPGEPQHRPTTPGRSGVPAQTSVSLSNWAFTCLRWSVSIPPRKKRLQSNYVTCEQCSAKGKICFWFMDHGECDLCGCPIYQGPAKKGRHTGRLFEACSQGCPGKFRWLN